MNMKKITLFFLLSCALSATALRAETITSFPESNFWLVDQTTPVHSFAQPPKDTIIGYMYKDSNIYQLTDTVPFMTVAIGNGHFLDLHKNGQFDFKLFLDTGQYNVNQTTPIYDAARRVSDGICFVMHTIGEPGRSIGGKTAHIGYFGISPSFAVEFDTEYNDGYDFEGNDGTHNTAHISYLRNGNMRALPGTYKPMQNSGTTSVARGEGFSVRIIWRKNFDTLNNTFLHYDLLTYIEEREPSDPQLLGQMFLRDSMRFYSLDDVVSGLKVDNNCQALVTGGITSATCDSANHQMIQFDRLQIEEYAPALTVNLHTEASLEWEVLYKSSHLNFPYNCNTLPTKLPDTIRSHRSTCIDMEDSSFCLEFKGLDMYESEGYIYDTGVANGPGKGKCSFNVMNYKHLFTGKSSVVVTAIVDGQKYIFEFGVNNNDNQLAANITQSLGIQLDTNGNGLLEIDNNSLKQAIQLPPSGDCRYLDILPLTGFGIVQSPTIDRNDILTFELDSRFCSMNIPIQLQCNCSGEFTLTVKNKDCKTAADCEGVEMKQTRIMINPAPSNAHGLSAEYTVSSTKSNSNIDFIEITDLNPNNTDIKSSTKNHSADSASCYINLSGCTDGKINKKFEICATLSDKSTCCDTFEVLSSCNHEDYDIGDNGDKLLKTGPPILSLTNTLSISYEVLADPSDVVGQALVVGIYDFGGNRVAEMMNTTSYPNSAELHYEAQSLVSGIYYIIFKLGDYIHAEEFIK